MNDEQIRKDFEEWMGEGGLSTRALERNSVGDYILMQAAHAWEVWKAANTHYAKPAAPVVLPEPDSYLFQHEDTGQTMFVDAQQVEWGFEANNPRLHKVSGVYTEQQVRELLARDLGAAPQPQADALDAESWVSESDSKPLESDGEVFVRFSDGTFGIGWASYWHDASNYYFVQWSHPDPDEYRKVTHWMKPPTIDAAIAAAKGKP